MENTFENLSKRKERGGSLPMNSMSSDLSRGKIRSQLEANGIAFIEPLVDCKESKIKRRGARVKYVGSVDRNENVCKYWETKTDSEINKFPINESHGTLLDIIAEQNRLIERSCMGVDEKHSENAILSNHIALANNARNAVNNYDSEVTLDGSRNVPVITIEEESEEEVDSNSLDEDSCEIIIDSEYCASSQTSTIIQDVIVIEDGQEDSPVVVSDDACSVGDANKDNDTSDIQSIDEDSSVSNDNNDCQSPVTNEKSEDVIIDKSTVVVKNIYSRRRKKIKSVKKGDKYIAKKRVNRTLQGVRLFQYESPKKYKGGSAKEKTSDKLFEKFLSDQVKRKKKRFKQSMEKQFAVSDGDLNEFIVSDEYEENLTVKHRNKRTRKPSNSTHDQSSTGSDTSSDNDDATETKCEKRKTGLFDLLRRGEVKVKKLKEKTKRRTEIERKGISKSRGRTRSYNKNNNYKNNNSNHSHKRRTNFSSSDEKMSEPSIFQKLGDFHGDENDDQGFYYHLGKYYDVE